MRSERYDEIMGNTSKYSRYIQQRDICTGEMITWYSFVKLFIYTMFLNRVMRRNVPVWIPWKWGTESMRTSCPNWRFLFHLNKSRSDAIVTYVQVKFLSDICVPCYELLNYLVPETAFMLEGAQYVICHVICIIYCLLKLKILTNRSNVLKWKQLAENQKQENPKI